MLVPPRYPQRVPPAPALTPERVNLSSPALASWEVSSDGSGGGGDGSRGSSDVSLVRVPAIPGGGLEYAAVLSSVPLPAFGDSAGTVPATAATTAAEEVAAQAAGEEPAAAAVAPAPAPTPPSQTPAVTPRPFLEQAAPVSGSFTARTVVCSYCSCDGATTRRNNIGGDNTNTDADNPSGERTPSNRQLVASSRALRRLPCGHTAHDACLIPIILEGIGRGDPALCLCPLDSSPLFPVLSRRRRRRRRRRSPGNENGASTTAAAAVAETGHKLFVGPGSSLSTEVTSAASASAVASAAAAGTGTATTAAGVAMSIHERAAATREALLRRNGGAGGGAATGGGRGGGQAAEILGIALVGSSFSLPPPHPCRRTTTVTMSAAGPHPSEEGEGANRAVVSAPEPGSVRRPVRVRGKREREGGGSSSSGGGGGAEHRNGGVGVVERFPRELGTGVDSIIRDVDLSIGGERIDRTGEGSAERIAARGVQVAPLGLQQRRRRTPSPIVARGSTVSAGASGGGAGSGGSGGGSEGRGRGRGREDRSENNVGRSSCANRDKISRATPENPSSLTSLPLTAVLVGSKTGVRGGGLSGSSPLPEAVTVGVGLCAVGSGEPPSTDLEVNQRFATASEFRRGLLFRTEC